MAKPDTSTQDLFSIPLKRSPWHGRMDSRAAHESSSIPSPSDRKRRHYDPSHTTTAETLPRSEEEEAIVQRSLGLGPGEEESSTASLGQSSQEETNIMKTELPKPDEDDGSGDTLWIPNTAWPEEENISSLQVYRESIAESKVVMLRQAKRDSIARVKAMLKLGLTNTPPPELTPYYYTRLESSRHIRLLEMRCCPSSNDYFYTIVQSKKLWKL